MSLFFIMILRDLSTNKTQGRAVAASFVSSGGFGVGVGGGEWPEAGE